MSGEDSYMEADSTNLPKVGTLMLFDFLKTGRKFSYAELENDKENLAINYGDKSIGYVSVLRNPNFCVVKAMFTSNQGAASPYIPVRALIYETKNAIYKVECKNCMPADCIHGFALLLWLHRRTEETAEQVINYYKEPSSIFNDDKQDATDHLYAVKPTNTPLRSVTGNYLNNNNCSPETKLFLHGSGIYSQSSLCSSQSSQTVTRTIQYASQGSSQKSNSDFELSQISNLETVTHEDCQTGSLAFSQPLPHKVDYTTEKLALTQSSPQKVDYQTGTDAFMKPIPQKVDVYSTQLSQTVYRTTQQASEDTLVTSSYDAKFSQNFNSQSTNHQHYEADSSVSVKPLSQMVDTYSTQFSQLHQTNQHDSENSVKSSYDSKYSQLLITREHCEAESSTFTQQSSQVALSQITNTENISPKQSKSVRKSPYSQNKSANSISPKTLKKQTLLSKKVSQLVKQPKIDNFFLRPKTQVEDSKPQIKHIFMGELVKNFLKLNKGTVEDFMAFAEKLMPESLCQEAEKLTRVQRTDLWMKLRYGRITASIIHEAAMCRTINGSLVNKILGKVSRYQSAAMKRGIDLEDEILKQVQIQENLTTTSSGLFLVPSCPIIGASPDAIGSDFIVEIKAPSSDTTFQNFLPNGAVSKKCKAQMYMQMYCTGMRRGIFCVADPDFEMNKKVTTVWLDYNEEEFKETLEAAKMFWFSAIFPRLVNVV